MYNYVLIPECLRLKIILIYKYICFDYITQRVAVYILKVSVQEFSEPRFEKYNFLWVEYFSIYMEYFPILVSDYVILGVV